MSDSFEARGYAVVPEVLAESECQSALDAVLEEGRAMRPLLLHASSKALVPSFRRVLHFVFGPPALPKGLRWGQAV